MEELSVNVIYRRDDGNQPQLPVISDVDTVEMVEINPSIIPEDSMAEVGVRFTRLGRPTVDAEIFRLTAGHLAKSFELYPLDGLDEPFIVNYDIGELSIFDEDVLKGVVRKAFCAVESPPARED